MEKLLYIADIDKLKEIGVYKKIISQCNEFNKFYEIMLLYRENDSLCIENITYKELKRIDNFFCTENEVNNKFIKANKYINIYRFNIYIFNFIKENKLNTLYIRKYNFFSKGLSYIKYAKKILNCNVICEIPTYPYKKEFLNKRKYLSYIMNRYFDYKIEKVADKITVVLGQDIELNSNNFMPILNGIDISNIKIKCKAVYQNSINLMGVAHVALWHGYDRVIEGLKIYYDNKNIEKVPIYFHIVGDGSELVNLKNLVDKYKLNDYVIFHGNKIGQDLDELFNKCDLGVGSLGMHRAGLTCGSTLKAREYCARGIPFIIGYEDNGFNKHFKYICKINPDESPIDINSIIDFYSFVKNDNCAENMREYARRNLTWEAVTKPVINVINKKNNNNN